MKIVSISCYYRYKMFSKTFSTKFCKVDIYVKYYLNILVSTNYMTCVLRLEFRLFSYYWFYFLFLAKCFHILFTSYLFLEDIFGLSLNSLKGIRYELHDFFFFFSKTKLNCRFYLKKNLELVQNAFGIFYFTMFWDLFSWGIFSWIIVANSRQNTNNRAKQQGEWIST